MVEKCKGAEGAGAGDDSHQPVITYFITPYLFVLDFFIPLSLSL
jgi:hypothetical protein